MTKFIFTSRTQNYRICSNISVEISNQISNSDLAKFMMQKSTEILLTMCVVNIELSGHTNEN